MARVRLSPEAKRDLVDIGCYIAKESGNQETADRFLDTLDRTFRLLASHPEMGESRVEFATGKYRSFSVGNYVIYFRPDEQGIRVARVLHGARDHGAIL